MDQTFANAVTALQYVPEDMRKRALALADLLSETDRGHLLAELQEAEAVLKKNTEEQGKTLDVMEIIVTDMERGHARFVRTGAESKDRTQDAQRAEKMLTDES